MSDKKLEQRFDRSMVIFKFKFMGKNNSWNNGMKGKKLNI